MPRAKTLPGAAFSVVHPQMLISNKVAGSSEELAMLEGLHFLDRIKTKVDHSLEETLKANRKTTLFSARKTTPAVYLGPHNPSRMASNLRPSIPLF